MDENRLTQIETDIAVLAASLLELAEKSAKEDEYNGEQTVCSGVYLDMAIRLREIVDRNPLPVAGPYGTDRW